MGMEKGTQTVTREMILKGLRDLGIKEGESVGVHSSLSRFGWVEGGADAVIDALLEAVGPEGNIVMPAYSTNREEVPLTDEDRAYHVSWKYRILPFDPAREGTWTGKITDVFWRRPGARRGSNPVHSLAAMGPRAEELCRGWDRLLAADGRILMLGVGLERCSSMHLAELYAELPERILARNRMPQALIERYRGQTMDIGVGPYPNFKLMEEPCRQHGILREGYIGQAPVMTARLKALIDLYAQYLREDPDRFYTEQ